MPSNGENQIPAGVNKTKPARPTSNKRMVSRDSNIKTSLVIGCCGLYKGNAVLNANK
tara:strand:+ start:367 stop:537 length:171 start_codon:yes stop_codon:yes gene_type:complete